MALTKEEQLLETLKAVNGKLDESEKRWASLADQKKQADEEKKALETKLDELNKRLTASEKAFKDIAGRAGIPDVPGANEDADGKKFSFRRAICLAKDKDFSNPEYGVEVEVFRAAKMDGTTKESRAMSAGSDASGGFMVPVQYLPEFIEVLRAKLVCEQLGATVYPNLVGGPVVVTKQTAGETSYWVAEGSAPTESSMTLGNVTLYPREAAAITYISNRLLRMTGGDAETKTRNSLAKGLARLMDLAGMQGSGGTQPLGIANTSGVNTTSMSGAPDVDLLYNMMYEVEVDNADEDTDEAFGWAMHPRTWNTLRQLKNGNGDYILAPMAYPGNVVGTQRPAKAGVLLGYPFRSTSAISTTLGAGAASRIIWGNWANLLIGRWGGISILASDVAGNAMANNQTYIRIIQEMDVAVARGESFTVDSTVATS